MMNHQDVIVAKQAEEETINKVKLVGSVVHKFRPRDNGMVLTVAAGHAGTDHAGTDHADYPNVVFYGEVAEIIDKTIEVAPGNYPRVCIEGMVQTTRRTMNGQTQYYQNIVGHTLSRAPTNLEYLTGKKNIGARKLEGCSEVCILGKVIGIYEIPSNGRSPIGTIVTLRTVDNGRVNFPRLTCFGLVGQEAAKLAENDCVCIAASIQTKRREGPDGKTQRYETMIGHSTVRQTGS